MVSLIRSLFKKKMVGVGEKAPDFTLPSQSGEMVHLGDFKGKKNVVLFFYPKDNTPFCIVESYTFRDNHMKFKELGAEVLGISSDTRESHIKFAARYKLPFHILSDVGNKVRSLYGVPSTMGILPGRVTFLIDKEGVVRHVFHHQFKPISHVKKSLQALQQI
jgi:peroxiredoxin Q/BCP